MNVTYTPPLMEQIRIRRASADALRAIPVVVFVKASKSFVMAVDPQTRQATQDRQQFWRQANRLTIVPRWEWVDEPKTLEVGEAAFA